MLVRAAELRAEAAVLEQELKLESEAELDRIFWAAADDDGRVGPPQLRALVEDAFVARNPNPYEASRIQAWAANDAILRNVLAKLGATDDCPYATRAGWSLTLSALRSLLEDEARHWRRQMERAVADGQQATALVSGATTTTKQRRRRLWGWLRRRLAPLFLPRRLSTPEAHPVVERNATTATPAPQVRIRIAAVASLLPSLDASHPKNLAARLRRLLLSFSAFRRKSTGDRTVSSSTSSSSSSSDEEAKAARLRAWRRRLLLVMACALTYLAVA